MTESTPLWVLFLWTVMVVSTALAKLPTILYINEVLKGDHMIITDSQVIFADAISEDGIDYGTGYYVTHTYSDGRSDLYGPFDYEEDAKSNNTLY